MPYRDQFQQFDPLDGVVPKVAFAGLSDIAERARALLNGASSKQIIQLAHDVEWIIDRGLTSANVHALDLGEDELDREQRSDGQWLHEYIHAYGDRPLPHEQFAHRHHAFAVLTLWLVVDCVMAISQNQMEFAGQRAIDAMEALCMAEKLFDAHSTERLFQILLPNAGDEIKTAIKSSISRQAQAAAIEKHRANHAARLRAIELYTSRHYPSVEAAAQAIAVQVFKAPRTVAKWIYDERKGRTPSLTEMPA
jgi:hypothetical protein